MNSEKNLLIATENLNRIDDWINITQRGRNYSVGAWEEDCDDPFNEKHIRDWIKCLISPPATKPESSVDVNSSEDEVEERRDRDQSKPSEVDALVADNAVTNGDMPTTSLLKDGSSRKVVVPREAVINSNAIAQEAEESIGNEEQVRVPVEQPLEQFEVNHSQGIIQNPEVQTALEYASNEEIVNNEQVKDKTKEIRAKKRRQLLELFESGGVVNRVGTGKENQNSTQGPLNQSEQSGSINSEDILHRSQAIIESFKEAVATSKKLGVIHQESDEELVNRMVQFKIEEQKNKCQALRRN